MSITKLKLVQFKNIFDSSFCTQFDLRNMVFDQKSPVHPLSNLRGSPEHDIGGAGGGKHLSFLI